MDSKPDKYDIEDYPKRYSGTYIQLQNKETKEITIGRISNLATNIEYWEGLFQTSKTTYRISSKTHNIIEGFPKIGATNCGKEVIISYRIPARQWKRGICYDNFRISNPLQKVFDKVTFQPDIIEWPITRHEIDVHTISECYNNIFFDTTSAIEKVQNLERFGAAINEVFWFSPSWYNNSIVLWYKETVIGEYKNDKLIILEKAFEQEIKDVFGDTLCLI